MNNSNEYDYYYRFLYELRKSGKVNMFESPAILQREFGLNRKEAMNIFKNWCKTFTTN